MERELVEFVAVGFSIALILCGFVVQPYFVPSGSMAPVLLGMHKDVTCPQCGRSFPVGVDEDGDARTDSVRCPNCGKQELPLAGIPISGGDQVLVWKGLYSFRPIERWDMVVFMHPDTPRENFVKRAVGFPGESIQIKHGDVYINGEILAKPFDRLEAMAVPVGKLNALDSKSPSTLLAIRSKDGKSFLISASDVENKPAAVRDLNSYNAGGDTWEREPVRDVIADMTIGERIDVQFHGLPGTPIRLIIEGEEGWLYVDGKRVRGNEVLPSRERRLTVAYWDGRIGVRWNGKPLFAEWPMPAGKAATDPKNMVPLLTVGGFDETPRDFELRRDVYYTDRVAGARGTAIDEPYRIGPKDYFMLGDNSDVSRDSRAWDTPGVPGGMFVGKPVLVHLPLFAAWRVPGINRTIQLPDLPRIRRLR